MPIDRVVSPGDAPSIALGSDALDELANLALEISRHDMVKHKVRPPKSMVPYADMSADAKANSRATVYRVVQALVMLGYIENPA